MSRPFRVAIAGLGTVGAGVISLLQNQKDLIAERSGRPVEVVAVSARARGRDRGVDLSSYLWVDDPVALAQLENVDAVVEVMGGSEGLALELAEKTLGNGKALVTANKAMLAYHGFALATIAERQGVALRYEAAVAGGIPIIKAVREGFSANKINAVYGILNGTCNYILTTMRETGRDFETVLSDAQAKGYAEADPSFDVDGIDAAHKLCLLSSLVFGIKPEFEAMEITGIRHITASDIRHAGEMGYRIKLLGSGRLINGNITQSVEPCLVPEDSQLGVVEGVFNAVFLETDYAGNSLSVGRGAGAGPTASAVVSDLIDLARGNDVPVFNVTAPRLRQASWAGTSHINSRFYIRIVVKDEPGVLADISAVMRDYNISMEEVLQHGNDDHNPVSIVIKTHKARQGTVRQALQALSDLPVIIGNPVMFRIEDFKTT